MKKIFLILSLSLIINISFAQQDPQFSHYMFNNMTYNPGFAGFNGEICANILSHTQWMRFDNAPLTQSLTLDSPIKLFGQRGGVGFKLMDDRYGFVQNFTAAGIISYHKELGLGKLGIGVEAGIFNKEFKSPEWKFPDQSESILPAGSRKLIFDMGFGAFYKRDNFYVGISSTHLLRPKLVFDSGTEGVVASEIFLVNHFYLTGAYNIQLANALIDLTPSFLLKSDGVSAQFDINLNLLYNKKFWAGVTYRNNDALIFLVGTSIFNNLRIGLSYDATFSAMRTASIGTFEVYVGYCFSFFKPDNAQKYHNVKTL